MVSIEHVRVYDHVVPWLLVIYTGLLPFRLGTIFARAVVDDYGNLVIVRGWM